MPGGLSLPQGGGFWDMANKHHQNAIGAYGAQTKGQSTKFDPPGKTVGGGLMAGAGMGVAGYQLGSAIGAGAGTAAAASAGAGAAAGGAAGAAGGAASGAAAGSSAGPYGAIIGAGLGILAYMLS